MLIPQTVKLVYCYFGNGIALGAYGPKDDVTVVLDALYNYQGHNDEATTFLSDNFGYVLTEKRLLLRGIANAIVTGLVHERINDPRNARHGVWERAWAEAWQIFNDIAHEPFLSESTPAHEYHTVEPQADL